MEATNTIDNTEGDSVLCWEICPHPGYEFNDEEGPPVLLTIDREDVQQHLLDWVEKVMENLEENQEVCLNIKYHTLPKSIYEEMVDELREYE